MMLSLDALKDKGFEPHDSGFEPIPLLKQCPNCGLLFEDLRRHLPGRSEICLYAAGQTEDLYVTRRVRYNTPTTPAPLCECGCGGYVTGFNCGVWSRWLPGHVRRVRRIA